MDFIPESGYISGLVIKTVKIILPISYLLQMVMTAVRFGVTARKNKWPTRIIHKLETNLRHGNDIVLVVLIKTFPFYIL